MRPPPMRPRHPHRPRPTLSGPFFGSGASSALDDPLLPAIRGVDVLKLAGAIAILGLTVKLLRR